MSRGVQTLITSLGYPMFYKHKIKSCIERASLFGLLCMDYFTRHISWSVHIWAIVIFRGENHQRLTGHGGIILQPGFTNVGHE